MVLPNEGLAVPCGRFRRERTMTGDWIGQFGYAKSYLNRRNAVPVDPIRLPLNADTAVTTEREGIFGALRDAMPDSWGRYVLRKREGGEQADEMDVMLAEATDRTGAIVFSRETTSPLLDGSAALPLETLVDSVALLAKDYDAFTRNTALTADERLLVTAAAGRVLGSSALGGARPKAALTHAGRSWIAKFPKANDSWDDPLVECAMLRLAQRAGITVPATELQRVHQTTILLVERFDRQRIDEGRVGRARYLSGLTVLESEEVPRDKSEWSYLRLADNLGRLSATPQKDRTELFRRMVFNACISNEDDHPRNHAVIAFDTDFTLSPAFDLTPSPLKGAVRRLALVTGFDDARELTRDANAMAMRRAAPRFHLSDDTACRIIRDVADVVQQHWEAEVRVLGGTDHDCAAIRPAFVPATFWYGWEA